MYFAVWATDRPGTPAVRERVRERHRAGLRNPSPHRVRVVLRGPTLEAIDGRMNGSTLAIEAGDIAASLQRQGRA